MVNPMAAPPASGGSIVRLGADRELFVHDTARRISARVPRPLASSPSRSAAPNWSSCLGSGTIFFWKRRSWSAASCGSFSPTRI